MSIFKYIIFILLYYLFTKYYIKYYENYNKAYRLHDLIPIYLIVKYLN